MMKRIASLPNVTTSEQELIDFILENPQRFLTLKPKEIADKAFVSLSTVYRLVDKLELNGVSDLQDVITAHLLDIKHEAIIEDFDYPLLANQSIDAMNQNMRTLYQRTIQNTSDMIDSIALEAITDALIHAQEISIYAASANVYLAENFKFQMLEIGVNVHVFTEDYMQRLRAANSNDQEVAIVVSFGGRSTTMQAVMDILKANNVTTVLLTSKHTNRLSTLADHVLTLSSFEDHSDKISSYVTRLSILYLFDMLYSAYFIRKYNQNIKFKRSSYKKMNPKEKE
ncbi:MurR/RpiR family transcriptional regulator [Erysipelothrix sp. HDW6C]|uniref:MurR/RpiR family transcriptional regulator n=1 Tax=Erysipelothrix sp. HDW6C TaxID=2714930 RepID=UPI001407326A|nr:MurR/RpiR family transcriptional regulator [Erysipelothrix sp. HDW6C]QIK69569.1 MurR/RpiR family transcriptional regulator [Erysipelothrix sp. HDW6C]